MKARIRQTASGMYFGEVCKPFDNILPEKQPRWKQVTALCFTLYGAEKQLQRWKNQNAPDEFEL